MSAVPCISANRLGALPVGWLVKPIGDLAVIATGNTPPTADASNYGDDFLFASPADIDDSKWIHQTGKRLSRKGFSVARPFPAKSVLFVCIGSTIGKCAIASVALTSNQQINAVFPSEHLDSEFLYYSLLMAAPGVKEQAGEQAVPLVNKTQFSGTLIAVPKLSEQRAIATALSDVDALIAGLEKLIAKKRDLKQAAMQQLLTGQTRLPGFSGEWEVKQLGEFARLYQPQTISQDKFSDDGYPVFGANGVVGMYERFNHASPQITISCRGNCGTVNRTSGPTWITGNAMVVNLDAASNVDKGFVYYALTFSDLSVLVTGSGIPQIVRGPLSGFAIMLPKNVAEQTAIATVLSDMDADLSALEARLAKARAIKQGMMQELLTGRTRLV